MAHRHRSGRSLRELREEADAVAARGLPLDEPSKSRRTASPRSEEAKSSPQNMPRLRMVWAVCDVGGRTVATYAFPEKQDAEEHAQRLTIAGKGRHFIRSVKQPM